MPAEFSRAAVQGKFWSLLLGITILAVVATSCVGGSDAPGVNRRDAPSETTRATLPGSGIVVQPARASWDTGYFSEAVYSKALEALGYEVLAHRELEIDDFYEAVATGEVDFWANGWFPLHTEYRDVFGGGAAIAGTVAASGTLQGFLVDKAGADEFNIKSLNDFKRDEVRQAYDIDGNGKADLISCQDGWSCERVVGFQLDLGGLRDFIDERSGPYSEAMGDQITRYRSGLHILFYTWTPNWTVARLVPGIDVVWIEAAVSRHPDGVGAEELSLRGVEGYVRDPCMMGFRGSDINVVANNEFLANNPSAKELFEVMSIPLGDIFKQNARMNAGEGRQDDIDKHAAGWIALNRDLFDSWIVQSLRAGR